MHNTSFTKYLHPSLRHYGVAHKMVHQYIAGKIVGEVVSANPNSKAVPEGARGPDGSDYQLPEHLINGAKEGTSRPTSAQGWVAELSRMVQHFNNK